MTAPTPEPVDDPRPVEQPHEPQIIYGTAVLQADTTTGPADEENQ